MSFSVGYSDNVTRSLVAPLNDYQENVSVLRRANNSLQPTALRAMPTDRRVCVRFASAGFREQTARRLMRNVGAT